MNSIFWCLSSVLTWVNIVYHSTKPQKSSSSAFGPTNFQHIDCNTEQKLTEVWTPRLDWWLQFMLTCDHVLQCHRGFSPRCCSEKNLLCRWSRLCFSLPGKLQHRLSQCLDQTRLGRKKYPFDQIINPASESITSWKPQVIRVILHPQGFTLIRKSIFKWWKKNKKTLNTSSNYLKPFFFIILINQTLKIKMNITIKHCDTKDSSDMQNS